MDIDTIVSQKLAALGHPARLKVIRLLVQAGPDGVPAGRLGEACGLAPNAVTFHLQKLLHAGLIRSRREGQFILYSAEFDTLLDMTETLVGACCADSPDKCGERCPSAEGASQATEDEARTAR
ncbi:MAG TPA: metalloregulator ArsR/SmtB family transcription factor [Gammaproteobacteria bacterium]|nr:metalloregulator ArsR/SmtB family transcription factor [Gammaproteobacteria bacterium]